MPREVHEHFDVDGNPTGTTVITRESPWDDASRERALRLERHEAGTCRCGCGQPIAEAYDKSSIYRVHRFKCQAGRAIEQIRKKDKDKAEAENKPDGWDDGLHYYAELVDPETVNNDPEGVD